MAVGLILAWTSAVAAGHALQHLADPAAGHACLLLPYPIRYANAALQQVSVQLELAARVHGASPWGYAGAGVVAPLPAPSVAAAMLLVFAYRLA